MSRPVRRQPGFQYGLIMLMSQVVNFGIDRIPPFTLGAMIMQSLLYMGLIKVPWNAEDMCISSLKVIKYRDWKAFFVSSFEHGSDMHLYYNMVSLLIKGSYLEYMYGSHNFAALLSLLTVGCSAMYVGLGWALTQITADYSYYTDCAVGFSAVLFALKVVANAEESNSPRNVGGMRVPGKFAVWTELVLIRLLVPNSSFVGHLGGALVGWLYSNTVLGIIVDRLIQFITGMPIVHEERFYRRRRFGL